MNALLIAGIVGLVIWWHRRRVWVTHRAPKAAKSLPDAAQDRHAALVFDARNPEHRLDGM
jgi:uncharacterized iron-regulated membrane protein